VVHALVLATARAYEAMLWAQDADLNDAEGVRYVARAAGG